MRKPYKLFTDICWDIFDISMRRFGTYLKTKQSSAPFACLFLVFAILFCAPVFSSFAESLKANVSEENSVALDDIRFPKSGWDTALLTWLERGPFILDRDLVFELPEPPKNSSEETQKELAYLHELAETARDEETVAKIISENQFEPVIYHFIREGLFREENYKTFELIRAVDIDFGYFTLERKMHFSRPRPTEIDKTLSTVIGNPQHAAYPSGHAGQTYLLALLLGDFDPENAERYKQFALDVAYRREVAGVHYPSDSEAGRKLAVDVFAKLRENTVFEKKYQEAKATYVPPDLKEGKSQSRDKDTSDISKEYGTSVAQDSIDEEQEKKQK